MPIAVLLCCYCGDPTEGLEVISPLRKFGAPVLDAIQEMPHPALQTMLDDSFPDGHHNYWKSSLQKELSDEAIKAIVEHGYKMPSPLSLVAVECYGGAAGLVESSDTAFPHRGLPWDVIAGAQWTEPAESL